MTAPKRILPVIVIAQFCCTSLWFAGNAVMSNLVAEFSLSDNALGHLTSFVQFGFISGTLVFAILTIADRFSPSRVFLVSAVLGSLFNAGTILEGNTMASLLLLRFGTGFFLAGIYPVGMKIAADYYEKGLGKSLGFLVGALVLGTAFPHLLKGASESLPWRGGLITTSGLALLGGVMMVVLVPNGPHRKRGQGFNLSAFLKVFEHPPFRAAAFGYFGHMWELYTFWAFVPIMLKNFINMNEVDGLNVPLWSFLIIGIGGVACVIGGYLAQKWPTKSVAFSALLLSGCCCLVSPLLLSFPNEIVFLIFLLFWGTVVIADSPLFSTLVAQNAQPEVKGTALTIVNCIGFAITILSIQLVTFLSTSLNPTYLYLILAIGPVFGLSRLMSRNP
ncbi:nitrate/nitrite transporter [Marinoscillum sp. MHG1-6]|uniref:MFS transporter n=1 Tax=Marinoscillum sp. MHG1-6 TaxID=2959627 RepID=UPI002157D1E1|nr:MFS transporter [Marinoscillum sp. MHG1-6]